MFRKLTIAIGFLVCIALATPHIGIEKDFDFWVNDPDGNTNRHIQSYSGIIDFGTSTTDTGIMTDRQFVRIVEAAYGEMRVLWQERLEPVGNLPRAMIALAAGTRIYFASSIRDGDAVKIGNFLQEDSIDTILSECGELSCHAHGGACGEISVASLYHWENKGEAKGLVPQPRVAAWIEFSGSRYNAAPCSTTKPEGWGCSKLVTEYGWRAVKGLEPDTFNENSWRFTTLKNPRGCDV
ncbi:hypothetical protein GP486_001145 [Trichoglossum hirsutum]|uniref:Uncharacterized protein n=1 Tax=Trichoglossum hirsutum TaxID=265104 RepID=A0A9P8LHQ0_9PEZI|nr:hypothetical protein GP486_001145 [Trichoglossum hirsutum]